MSVTVTTPAERTRLCTVDEVRSSLGLTDNSMDPTLELMIDAATAAIEQHCGTVFCRQTYSEVLAGSDTEMLVLSRTPIVGTPTVACEGEPVVDFEVRDAEYGLLYREVGWKTKAWVGWDVEPTRTTLDAPVFAVAYTAGYIVPGGDDSNLPANIRVAAAMAAAHLYRRDRSDPDILTKKVEGFSITYREPTGETGAYLLPANVRALLPPPRIA